MPYQVIDPPASRSTLPVVRAWPPTRRSAWLAADAAAPFDLAAGPLFRATLLRLAADEHVLALAMHHVVGDEWSAGILRRELAGCTATRGRAVAAAAAGAVRRLRGVAAAVADRRGAGRASSRYWRERLAGAPVAGAADGPAAAGGAVRRRAR